MTVASCIGVCVLAACGASGAAPRRDADVTAETTALAAWAARALPADAEVAVDAADVQTQLARVGVTTTVDAGPFTTTLPDHYRISSGGTGAATRGLSTTVTAVPVARFGVGATGWVVDQLVDGSTADVVDGLATDRDRRAAAGSALVTNPAVSVCDACRPVLAAGGLDLRAAALVAVLAGSGPVTVTRIVADPAETAAGRPARSIVVGAVSAGAVSAVAAATAGDYRPTITEVGATSTTLTWPLAAATATTTLTGATS